MEWRLHIGAHKTATTHLQDLLAANRQALAQQGVHFYPRELIRKSGLIFAVHDNYWSQAKGCVRRKRIDEIVPARTEAWRSALISEENIIGVSAQLLQGLYPAAYRRLLPWASIMPPEKTCIYLGIRNQADILPSAYSQALRDGTPVAPFSHFLGGWIQNRPSWLALTGTVSRLFPASSVAVWKFEDYVRDPAGILRELSGVPAMDVEQVAVSNDTRMLTAAAVAAIEKLAPGLPPAERKRRVRELAEKHGSSEPYAPLKPADRRCLADIYESDLEYLHKQSLLLSL